MTCDASDEIWHNPSLIMDRVIHDMEAEGLLQKPEIQEAHVFRAAEAYPKFVLGFEKHLVILREFLKGFTNIVSTGRQGCFAFSRSASAMKKAWADVQTAGLLD
ncbi:MAG: hypothetical protein WCC06_11510 [Candidatus Aminicenantales bacterium]